MVTAIVLINTTQGRTPEVAQALIDLPALRKLILSLGCMT